MSELATAYLQIIAFHRPEIAAKFKRSLEDEKERTKIVRQMSGYVIPNTQDEDEHKGDVVPSLAVPDSDNLPKKVVYYVIPPGKYDYVFQLGDIKYGVIAGKRIPLKLKSAIIVDGENGITGGLDASSRQKEAEKYIDAYLIVVGDQVPNRSKEAVRIAVSTRAQLANIDSELPDYLTREQRATQKISAITDIISTYTKRIKTLLS